MTQAMRYDATQRPPSYAKAARVRHYATRDIAPNTHLHDSVPITRTAQAVIVLNTLALRVHDTEGPMIAGQVHRHIATSPN